MKPVESKLRVSRPERAVSKEEIEMPVDILLVLIVAVLLVAYLTYALLQAEKF